VGLDLFLIIPALLIMVSVFVVTGMVSDCRLFQGIMVTRRNGDFEFRRTAIFELQPPKGNEISAERKAVLEFLFQDPYEEPTGLNVSNHVVAFP
jgi:hypothetical protein